LAEDFELDPLSRAELESADGPATQRKLEILEEYSRRPPAHKPRLLTLRFLVSPTELLPDERGGVRAMRLVRNRLVAGKGGVTRAEPTGHFEELPVGLVFRSVGYRGVALPGVPFDETAGTVPNERGRVMDPAAGRPVTGVYVAGWIKRGPSGVIGTNKPDAAETAETMLADLAAGAALAPAEPSAEAAEAQVRRARPAVISFSDWRTLDRLETERGKALGRPRLKFTSVEEMLDSLGAQV